MDKQFTLTFNESERETMTSALDIKIASIRRAINTNRNPKFRVLYDDELNDALLIQGRIKNAPAVDELLKKK